MPPYQYHALESDAHIRLVRIAPDSGDGPLSGSLIHASLDSRPTYETLSYTWGFPILCRKIVIDGLELAITANLDSALKRMRSRSPDSPTLIWADGVCINQKDIEERNQQVHLMRRIYSECQTGLIYLGEEADGSDELPDFLNTLIEAYTEMIKKTKGQLKSFALENDFSLPDSGDTRWKMLRAVLERPWFRRIWIIQEYSLPQKILMICGKWEISGTILALIITLPVWQWSRKALDGLTGGAHPESGHTKAIALQQLHLQIRLYLNRPLSHGFDDDRALDTQRTGSHLSLLYLLRNGQMCKTTDPRDHFFALIGLANNVDDSSLAADYSKSLEDVQTDFGRHLVKRGYGMSLLYQVENPSSRISTLPSWLPSWTDPTDDSTPANSIWPVDLEKQPNANINLRQDRRSIDVSGSLLDVVEVLGMYKGDEHWPNGWIQEIEALVAGVKCYPSGQDVEQAVWRTIIADRSLEKEQPAPEDYYRLYRLRRMAIDHVLPSNWENLPPYELLDSMSDIFRFDSAVGKLRTFRFCITKGGLFGMVPHDTLVGDSIFVVKGDPIKSTFVVRKDAVQDHYTWVGHAYVHHIWNVLNFEELRWEEIVIN